jgi:hypothetical protein
VRGLPRAGSPNHTRQRLQAWVHGIRAPVSVVVVEPRRRGSANPNTVSDDGIVWLRAPVNAVRRRVHAERRSHTHR